MLCVECDRAGGEVVVNRARVALTSAGVNASIGLAMPEPAKGLNGAWQRADGLMHEEKRRPGHAVKIRVPVTPQQTIDLRGAALGKLRSCKTFLMP